MFKTNLWHFETMKDQHYFIQFKKITKKIFAKNQVNFVFYVVNNSVAKDPIYSPTKKTIYLTTSDTSLYYQQIIYQLAHEMIHQLIYEILNNTDYNGHYLKKSEIICSSFAFYVIDILGWDEYLKSSLASGGGPHSKYKKEIVASYKKLLKNFKVEMQNHINDAVAEMMEVYNIKEKPFVANMHVMPRVLIRKFIHNSEEKSKKVKYIAQRFVRMNESVFKRLDKIHQKVEKNIPAIIRAISNSKERFSIVNGSKEIRPIKFDVSYHYKEWYDILTIDQKFSGELMPYYMNDLYADSIGRFASILELLLCSLFVRNVSNYDLNFNNKNIFKEITRTHKFIQSMSPIQIFKTSKPYPIDYIKNILTYSVKELPNPLGQKEKYLLIRLRLTESIFLETFLQMYWLNTYSTASHYLWKDIYNNKIQYID